MSVRVMTTVWTIVLITISVVSSTKAGAFTPGSGCSYFLGLGFVGLDRRLDQLLNEGDGSRLVKFKVDG